MCITITLAQLNSLLLVECLKVPYWGQCCLYYIAISSTTFLGITIDNKLNWAEHINKLLNILTFRQLYLYSIQMFMYKYNSGLLPTIFDNMFKLNQDVHSYNTRQFTQIHVSMATLEIRLRSVRIKGAIIWNYFNTRLKFTSYSIMNYKCILNHLYYTMMLI